MKIPSDVLTAPKTDSIDLSRLEWTMINVNEPLQQGDAHLISLANGINLLIDARTAGPGGKFAAAVS